VEMLLKPRDARSIIKQLGYRKVYHAWEYIAVLGKL
jgi:hypothetical protein